MRPAPYVGPGMTPAPLPLSFGPAAVTLRTRDGGHVLEWFELGRIVSGGERVTATTLHLLADGTLAVTTHSELGQKDRIYKPDDLAQLFREHGLRVWR